MFKLFYNKQFVRQYTLEDVEEIEGVIEQRQALAAVREFLEEHDADASLIETIDVAVQDLDLWSNPELEAILLSDRATGMKS